MTNKITNFIEKFYLKGKLPPSLGALFMNRILQAVSFGFFNLFLPIFLYQQFNNSLEIVLIYFIIDYLIYALTVPLGARLMSKLGLRGSMIISSIFLIAFYIAFRFFSPVYLYLIIPLMLKVVFRNLYWVPYHTEFAEFTDKLHRGKEIGLLEAIYAILSIGIPITAGFILSNYGFNYLFLLAIIIIVLSIIPLFLIEKVEEKYSWGYFKTYKKLFSKGNKHTTLAFFADGLQDNVGLVIWPVFIFVILNEQYSSVGIVASLTILATVVLRLVFGSLSDKMSKHKLLRIGSVFYAFGWVFKSMVSSATHVFAAGTFHDFSKAVMRIPFDTIRYEKAADWGHYVDEYTVLREIAICTGRVVTLVVALVLIQFVDIRAVFYIAAVASLFVSAL